MTHMPLLTNTAAPLPRSSATRWLMSSTYALLISIMAVIAIVPATTAAFTPPLVPSPSTPQTVHLCYLYFGVITDLGWTYSYNAGRINAHNALAAQYPNTTFKSTFTENVGSMTSEDKHATIENYVTTSGCDIVLSNNAELMNGEDDAYAAAYPHVWFVLLHEYRMENTAYPNRLYVAGDFTGGYYAAGVAAGMQSRTCIGFLAAWSTELDPTNAWAGFLLGVRSVNRTMPVHVVPQGSWYDPVSDGILVDAMINQLQCTMIGRYSDPFTTDVAVSALRQTDLFTAGSHSDLERFVGDSVLVSVYIDWTVVLLNVLRPLFDTGTFNRSKVHFYGLTGASVVVSGISPRAPTTVSAAVADAIAYVKQQPNESIVCGVVPLRNGGYLMGNATPNTTCKVPYNNIDDLITDAYVVHHAEFVDPTTCPPGTYYMYDALGSRSLRCIVCPNGAYSTLYGSSECSGCPPGTDASPSRMSCDAQRLLTAGEAVGIAIGAFAAALLVSAVYVQLSQARDANAAAPRSPPLCLVFVDIEASSAITKLCGTEMDAAKGVFLSRVRSVIQRSFVYETTVDGSDCVVVACPTAVDAVGVAVELQEAIAFASWPPIIRDLGGLKPRIAVQLCTNVTVRFHARTWRYVYEGVDVEAGRALVELAPSGAILADQHTMDAAMAEDEFRLVLAYEMIVKLWRAAKSPMDMLVDLQCRLGAVSNDPASASALRVRLESTNVYALDSKQLSSTANGALPVIRTVAAGGGKASGMVTKGTDGMPTRLPALEGTDPELDQSMHSSFDTHSSLTLGKQALDIGPPEVALALYGMFQTAEELSPERKKKLLMLISDIFSLQRGGRHLSSRRVAAALAFRILEPSEKTTAADGPTTAASGGSTTGVDDSGYHSRRHLGNTSGGPTPRDNQGGLPAPVSPHQAKPFSLTALEAISEGRVPSSGNNPFTLPPALRPREDAGSRPQQQHGQQQGHMESWAAPESSGSPMSSPPPHRQRNHNPTSAAHLLVLPGGQLFQPDDSYSTVSASQREVEMLALPSASTTAGAAASK